MIFSLCSLESNKQHVTPVLFGLSNVVCVLNLFDKVKVCIYRIREKSLVEKKPGGKNGSGKKWKESLVERKPGLFWKRWKKPGVTLFLSTLIL